MMTTFHKKLFCVLLAAQVLSVVETSTRSYIFRVSYITGSPDGVRTSKILGINGKFPGPVIEAEVGDTLEITVINEIQDGQNTTMHWHGILQRGTPFEDGPSGITQCPIKAGKSQIYKFPVQQAGTYWYHSHVNSQYTEGLWGLLIVRAKPEVWQHLYDDEITITLNDWYHTSGLENEEYLLSPESEGAPPYPSSVLMNAVGRYPCVYALAQRRICLGLLQKRPVFLVQPGKTYRLRLINTSGWTAFNFTVEGHMLHTIEVDGIDTTLSLPLEAVQIAAGQRYSFLVTVPRNARVGSRFLIRASARTDFLFTRPKDINPYPQALFQEVTGVFQYSRLTLETTEHFDYSKTYQGKDWNNMSFLSELSLLPYDRVPAPEGYDKSVELNISFIEDQQQIRKGSFNHRPEELPTGMPQLAMMLHNETIPDFLYPVYIQYGDIIQVVVNNPEMGPRPIHVHGHHFWVMGMGAQGDGTYNPNKHSLQYNGVRRDTVLVKEESWLVIRFRADNPGVWTLHCHVDWHMLTGMMMTFVEAPELARNIEIPFEARKVCADHNISI